MPRPRTPTNILKLRDSFTTHPERARHRVNEPTPERGIGPAPAWMSDAQAAVYREVVRASHPGTLSGGDQFVVELCAVLLHELRADAANMPAARLSRLHAALGSLGLTPSDRSRISAAKARADGPAPFQF